VITCPLIGCKTADISLFINKSQIITITVIYRLFFHILFQLIFTAYMMRCTSRISSVSCWGSAVVSVKFVASVAAAIASSASVKGITSVSSIAGIASGASVTGITSVSSIAGIASGASVATVSWPTSLEKHFL